MQLYYGNKNYSSWSMRPWVAMTAAGIAFDEVFVPLDTPSFKSTLAQFSPAGKVPLLVDNGFAVWDTLAIIEYAAEHFPNHTVWPANAKARARARSLCAQMHSGFTAVRSAMPMNIEANLAGFGHTPEALADVKALEDLWLQTRSEFGQDGAFLFGAFSAADAYFAPVVMRFNTYAPPLSEGAKAYCAAVTAHPAVKAWIDGALKEKIWVAIDEPYRSKP